MNQNTGACESGDYLNLNDNEWSIINGMRRDAKLSTVEDGGSREIVQLELASSAEAGGLPSAAKMRLFFKYDGEYHRYAGGARCSLGEIGFAIWCGYGGSMLRSFLYGACMRPARIIRTTRTAHCVFRSPAETAVASDECHRVVTYN